MEKRTALAVGLAVAFLFVWFKVVAPAVAPKTRTVESERINPSPDADSAPAEETAAVDETAAEPPAADDAAETVDAGGVVPAMTADEGAPAEQASQEAPPQAATESLVPEDYRQENLAAAEFAVSTEVLTVTFSSVTGSVKSVVLNGLQNLDRTDELALLDEYDEGLFATSMGVFADEGIRERLWLAGEPVEEADGTKHVSFSTVLETGVRLTKTYILSPGRYGFGLELAAENLSDREQPLSYTLTGPTGIPSEDFRSKDVTSIIATVPVNEGLGGKLSIAKKPAAHLLTNGAVKSGLAETVVYAGAANRYFAAVLRPAVGPDGPPVTRVECDSVFITGASPLLKEKSIEELRRSYSAKNLAGMATTFYTCGAVFYVEGQALAAAGQEGDSVVHNYLMYCGPKEKEALAAFDEGGAKTGFPALLDYGMLEPLVKVIVLLLSVFHAAVRNWGLSIIMLTLLMRAFMHPLMRKSQISMAKMQKLQPQIKKLQEKYKNDKQRLGQEQMKLMKEAGANPLGGCLPLLIQMPIFFALYRSLMISYELRHSPFVFWIDDLAQPDRLATFSAAIPLLNTNFLNLLPLLLAVAMAAQQRLMPKAATPEAAQQQKMMALIMPIFLGFILYSVASGLNLYILTSTVFGMLEQWWIRRHLAAQGHV
jgi:YidC/Oxa1 family membrane protein insertase